MLYWEHQSKVGKIARVPNQMGGNFLRPVVPYANPRHLISMRPYFDSCGHRRTHNSSRPGEKIASPHATHNGNKHLRLSEPKIRPQSRHQKGATFHGTLAMTALRQQQRKGHHRPIVDFGDVGRCQDRCPRKSASMQIFRGSRLRKTEEGRDAGWGKCSNRTCAGEAQTKKLVAKRNVGDYLPACYPAL